MEADLGNIQDARLPMSLGRWDYPSAHFVVMVALFLGT